MPAELITSHSALYLKHIYIFFIIYNVNVYTYLSSIAPLPVVARYVLTFLEYMTLCLFFGLTLPLVWNLIWKQYIYSQIKVMKGKGKPTTVKLK